MKSNRFDDLSEVYATLVDWPKRLNNETPFYRRWFEARRARSVLDVACGTGQHAALFHSWGLRVEGADVSPAMIDLARQRFGDPDGMRWVVRGFDQCVEADANFDAAICVGNSLALAADVAGVDRAIANMFQAVRRGGIVVMHVLNLWRLDDGPCRWQKATRSRLPDGDVLIVKGVHRCGRRGFVNLVVATLEEPPVMKTESVPFLGLEAEEVERMVRRAGATTVRVFGDYHDGPYISSESTDLIMVAER
jgi:SAM-dependent methyltransferase